MLYAGIDAGKNGALAIISDGFILDMVVFDEQQYVNRLKELSNKSEAYGGCICCLEEVHAMPGQGVTSMFSFGQNFGFIQGLLKAYGIPYELVRPQKWKKFFGITADKNTSIAVAERLFPGTDFRKSERARKPHDGMCEALLLAEYARRNFG